MQEVSRIRWTDCRAWTGKEADSRYTNDLGFDGRIFHIKRLDTGKVITTNNLRCNGKVPKEYEVKDNAVFLGE